MKANDASSADASAPEVFQDQGEEPRPSGRVVGIIKRSWKPYCGSIESAPRGQYMLFIAADRAIPKIRYLNLPCALPMHSALTSLNGFY